MNEARIKEVLELFGPRIVVAGDIAVVAHWCFVPWNRVRFLEKGFRKHLCRQDNLELLTSFMDVVGFEVKTNRETWEDSTRVWCEDEGIKLRNISRLVRIATTGQENGPGLFAILEFLGVKEALDRMSAAIVLGNAGSLGAEFTPMMWLD